MRPYLNLLRHVRENGKFKPDRTHTGTYSVFGAQCRYDLQDGFPLVTTKRVSIKNIIYELLWMLKGDTNVNWLKEHGVNIWNAWVTPELCLKQGRAVNDLGPVYGHIWREWRSHRMIRIEPRTIVKENPITYPLFVLLEPDSSTRRNSPVGKTFVSFKCGMFKVIRAYRPVDSPRDVYDVQFQKTGYVSKSVQSSVLRNKAHLKDPFYPGVFGMGCLGDVVPAMDGVTRSLYQQWFAMLSRCYNINHVGYSNYGGRGVFVCNRWLTFANFAQDVTALPGWRARSLNLTGVELDKDYYGSNCYSKDTCVWLTQSDNTAYTGKALSVSFPNGGRRVAISAHEASRLTGLSRPSVRKHTATGKTVNGYKFEALSGLWRKEHSIDQISSLIHDIRTDPHSRRLIVSAWDPAYLDEAALASCHTLFQCYVADGCLSLHLYQRSGDLFLGGPYNIASYAALTLMLAQVTGLKPGEFIHSFGDAHIYANHLEQVDLQMSREPKPLPRLILNPAVTNIFDFKYKDFTLDYYDPWPAIKAPVAV